MGRVEHEEGELFGEVEHGVTMIYCLCVRARVYVIVVMCMCEHVCMSVVMCVSMCV